MPTYDPVPDIRITVYSADTDQRRNLPLHQVQRAEWSDERYGGFKEFSLEIAADLTDLTIAQADKVEISYKSTLYFRGWVTQTERVEGTPSTLRISGHGKILPVGKLIVQRPYVYAGPVDVARPFRDIAADVVTPDYPSVVVDAQDIGTTLTVVEGTNKPLIEVLNGLAQQAENLCLFGCDVDDDNADRLYIKPFDSDLSYTIQVPGINTNAPSVTTVSADICNRVKIVGGNATDPNLIYNSSFERPRFGGEGVGNLLHDASFEANTDWTLGSGASRKAKGGSEGQPYHGSYMVELDNSGEYAQQTQNPPDTAITVGHDYTFSVWAKCENESYAVAGTVVLTWLTSGGSTISTETLTLASPLSGSTPRLSATWQQWKLTSRAPATAAGFKVRAECTSGGGATKGILIDLVEVYDSSILYQDGWEFVAYGSAVANAANWVYKDPAGAYDGAHCVFLDVSASDTDGQDAHLQPIGQTRFPVLGGASYVVSLWVKSPPGITTNGKMQLELWEYKSDGSLVSGTSSKTTIAAGSGWSDWTQITLSHTVAQTAAFGMVYLGFRGNSKVLVDAVCMRGSAAGTTYIREGQYEEQIDVTDGDLTGLLSGVTDSITDYGYRDDVVRIDSITNRTDALSYAAALFNARAIPWPQPAIEIIDPADFYRPGQLVRFVGAHGSVLMGGQSSLPIVRIRWRWDGMLRATLEVKQERPDLAEEIVKKLRKQLQPPASVTYSQGVAGTSSGTGGGSPTTPGGSSGDVQYNGGSGNFSGESALTYDATNNQLTVPGITIGEDLALTGDISPAQITANQNDYNPTNLSTASVLRLSTDASRNITGLQGGSDGRIIAIHNVGSYSIVLKNANTGSSAANRFAFSADLTLTSNDCVMLQYDATSSRWRALQLIASGGTGTPAGSNTQIQYNDSGSFGAEAGFEYDKASNIATLPNILTTASTQLTGFLYPAQITSNQNNYAPSGLDQATIVSIYSDAARQITGIVAQWTGQVIYLINSGSYTITLKNASASSTTINRFAFSADFDLLAGAGCILYYSDAGHPPSSRWVLLGASNPGSSAGGSNGQIQYNNSGVLGGESGFEYDASTDVATIPTVLTTAGRRHTGFIAPSQIASNQSNYNPTNFATSSIVSISSSAAYYISGFVAGADGQCVYLYNSGSYTITLKNESSHSTASNRLSIGSDFDLIAGAGCHLYYCSSGSTPASRWIIVGSSRPSGGNGTVTSVALTLPSEFSVSGSPITASGTLAGTWANQSANLVMAGPVSGSATTPTFRALESRDMPFQGDRYRARYFNDFLFGNGELATSTSGTNAAAAIAANTGDTGGHPGVCTVTPGTTSTGRAYIGTFGAFNGCMKLGYGTFTFETDIYLDTLSDATDTYTIWIGCQDTTGSGNPTDGVFFRYTHGTNSGKFECVCRASNTETASDSAQTVAATTWYRLGFVVNAAATSVTFYIDGSSVATVTTNVPGTGNNTATGCKIEKSAGTATRNLLIDYILVDYLLTTPR